MPTHQLLSSREALRFGHAQAHREARGPKASFLVIQSVSALIGAKLLLPISTTKRPTIVP
jgi:hypothetical protein